MKRRPGFLSATGVVAAVVVFLGAGAVIAPRRAGAVQSRRAERPDQRRRRDAPVRHGRTARRRHQPRPARQRVQRLPSGAVELAHHGRRLPRLPRRRRATRSRPGTASTAGSRACRRSPTCTACHPEHNGPHGALTVRRRGALRFRARHDRVLAQDSPRDRVRRPLHLRRLPPQGLRGGSTRPSAPACHADIDAAFMKEHEAAFGTDCLGCHDGTGNTSVDHSKFAFKLTGKHASVACDGCHKGAQSLQDYQRRAAGLLLLSRQGRRARRRLRHATAAPATRPAAGTT